MKRRNIFIIVIAISFVSLMIFLQYNRLKNAKVYFIEFNQTHLEGQLNYLSISTGLVYFKIDDSGYKHRFIPVELPSNPDKDFYGTAEIGDFIIKRPYSDTLTLIKNERVYYYGFKELGN